MTVRWINRSPVFTGLDLRPELVFSVRVPRWVGRLVDRWNYRRAR